MPGTEVHTDESSSYRTLHNLGFTHKKVNHSVGGYVSADGCTVNALEGFWDMLKRGLYGAHISVRAKHLPKYLSEFEYRWNMRHTPHLMLDRLLYSFTR